MPRMMPSLDINDLFSYHSLNDEQLDRCKDLRSNAKMMAAAILGNTRPGADQSAAIRKLRECLMTCNAAIALEPKE